MIMINIILNIMFGLQLVITLSHWFVSPFHPFIFIMIFFACVVYLCGINNFLITLYNNFGIVISADKKIKFHLAYLLKFIGNLFVGIFYIEFIKWFVITFEYLSNIMMKIGTIRYDMNQGEFLTYFFKKTTLNEISWLLPTNKIGVDRRHYKRNCNC